MKDKKLELIYEKVLQRIENTATDFYNRFIWCKSVDDVLDEFGVEDWEDVLYKVGYSYNYRINEVNNFSLRFSRLRDKVLVKLKENEDKVMKMAKLYNE